jgi:hypothetical protein
LVFGQYTQKTRDKQGEVNGGLDNMHSKSCSERRPTMIKPGFDSSRTCSYILFVPADEAGIVFDARMAELARLHKKKFRRASPWSLVLSKSERCFARMAELARLHRKKFRRASP